MSSNCLNESVKIVVIDDMKLNFSIVQKVLNPFGVQLIWVQDPQNAVARVQEVKPHLILLDFEMPHLNGPDVCRLLRANIHCASIPVVFCTSAAATKTLQAAFDAGADDYINKPIFPAELVARLTRILQNQKLQTELVQSLEEQKTMGRILSHDLNNYISIIKLSIEHLKKTQAPKPEF